MKRFYCTICNKIKHVRVMPRDVVNVESTNPSERVGTCRRHDTRYKVSSLTPRKVGAR